MKYQSKEQVIQRARKLGSRAKTWKNVTKVIFANVESRFTRKNYTSHGAWKSRQLERKLPALQRQAHFNLHKRITGACRRYVKTLPENAGITRGEYGQIRVNYRPDDEDVNALAEQIFTAFPQFPHWWPSYLNAELYAEIVRHCHIGIRQAMFTGYVMAQELIKAIEQQGFDEHGGWESSADFDSKGRGQAINADVYGFNMADKLAIVQVRHFERNRFGTNVRKNYFLLGYNENGNPFAHSIPAATVNAALKRDSSPQHVVDAAQAWIWGIHWNTLSEVLRNGDTALIPLHKNLHQNVFEPEDHRIQVIDSHVVRCEKAVQNGNLYVQNPTLFHEKGQHPAVSGKGWYKVVVGNRARFSDFARPTAD